MHPFLFHFDLHPLFNRPDGFTVSSYLFFFVLGIVLSTLYGVWRSSKELSLSFNQIMVGFNALLISGFLGAWLFGQVKLQFSEADTGNPNGLILYGAIVFIIPVQILLAKIYKYSALKIFDIFAVAMPILFIFVRIGCFMSGCCYGIPTDSFLGVIFTDPYCKANPKGIPLHPTQLYSVITFLIIIVVLSVVKKRQQFSGQLFLLFLIMYSIGRGIIEGFRGDDRRGIIFEGILTYSQAIAAIIGIISIILYLRLRKKSLNP